MKKICYKVKVISGNRLTIPIPLLRTLELEKGSRLKIIFLGDKFLVEEVK